TLTLLDVITGAVVANYATRLVKVRPYSFSPDGTKVIVGQFQDPRFVVMDVRDGMILLKEKHPKAANVRCAVWRPDGSGFFIGTESFKIYGWALENNSLPRQLIGHQGNVLAMAMDPKGEWLVSQSDDGTTRLWNAAGVQTMAVLPYTGAEVRFSEDGRFLLCEDREGHQVRMVELVPSPICRQFSVPHPDPDLEGTRGCWYVTFSPDGGLLSAGDTRGIFHFDGHSGQLLGHMPVRKCWSLGWARDGSALYSASNTGLQRWPVQAPERPAAEGTGEGTGQGTGADSGAGFGEAVAVAGEVEAAGETWSLGAPALWARESEVPRRRLNHLAVSQDHQLVALAFDEHVALYRPPNGENPLQLPAVPGLLDAVAVSPEGSLVAASQQKSGGVFVWDTARLERMLVLPTQFAEATLAFHPDGQRLYSGDFDALTCWNARTGAMVWRVPCPARSPSSVQCALSADGSLMAANLSPETIHLIQPGTGLEITRLRHPSPLPITYLAISQDQSRLAAFCVGHVVQLWDLVRLRSELAARGIDWKHPALPAPQVPLTWRFPVAKGG
ncbi:MAG: repeat-containing protein, partial [Verrucomicrobiales bacterium]|nr:repeat-containing protein [Verrucomicrobiales bacterium]